MDYSYEKIDYIEKNLQMENVVKGDRLKSLEQMMKETNTTALTVAVIEECELKWCKGYGITDKVSNNKVNTKTLFQAASISKAITALAVMTLVEDKKLDLDTDVNEYLTSWKLPQNDYTKYAPVTLRNLLSHTAGINVSGFLGYNMTDCIPSIIEVLNGSPNSNSMKVKVDIKPNTQYLYSGGGISIVQQVLVDQMNLPFEELMKLLVLTPLDMESSFFQCTPLSETKNIAVGHDVNGKQLPGKYHVYPEMAAAGLWTTIEDLAKYVVEVQKSLKNKSNKILSKRFMELMVTPVLNGEYNLGLTNFKVIDEVLVGHTGSNVGYKSSMMFHKDDGYGLVVMTNSDLGGKIKMPLLRSVAAANNWGTILRPVLEVEEITDEVLSLFCHKFRVSLDESLIISECENKLFCKLFNEDQCELTFVGNYTFINSKRDILIKYSQISNQYFMNGKEIIAMSNDDHLPLDFVEKKDVKQAVELYKDIMRKNEKYKSSLERRLGYFGLEARDRGEYDIAIVILNIVVNLFPESLISWFILGEIYFEDEKYDLSIQAMENTLKLNPKNVKAKKLIKDATIKLGLIIS
ncbi:MAG: serine hydrolase [Clostridiales bacterium]|nr:serine hydrolase [Clostridiales bacterium]